MCNRWARSLDHSISVHLIWHMWAAPTPWLISFITAQLEWERLLLMALIPFTYTLRRLRCKGNLSHGRN